MFIVGHGLCCWIALLVQNGVLFARLSHGSTSLREKSNQVGGNLEVKNLLMLSSVLFILSMRKKTKLLIFMTF